MTANEQYEITSFPVNENDIILVRFTDEIDYEEARKVFEALHQQFNEHLVIAVRSGVYLDAVSRADYKKWLEMELAWLEEGDKNEDILCWKCLSKSRSRWLRSNRS